MPNQKTPIFMYSVSILHKHSSTCYVLCCMQESPTINMCKELPIKFPTCHDKQREIMSAFQVKSWVEFDNC